MSILCVLRLVFTVYFWGKKKLAKRYRHFKRKLFRTEWLAQISVLPSTKQKRGVGAVHRLTFPCQFTVCVGVADDI